jgi:hypothetical protein
VTSDGTATPMTAPAADTSTSNATTTGDAPIFALGGSAYLLALLVVHVLSPRLAPARVGPSAKPRKLLA